MQTKFFLNDVEIFLKICSKIFPKFFQNLSWKFIFRPLIHWEQEDVQKVAKSNL